MRRFDKWVYSILLEYEDAGGIELTGEQLKDILVIFCLDFETYTTLQTERKIKKTSEINLLEFLSNWYYYIVGDGVKVYKNRLSDVLKNRYVNSDILMLKSEKILNRYISVDLRSGWTPGTERLNIFNFIVRFSVLLRQLEQIKYDDEMVTLIENGLKFKDIVNNFKLSIIMLNEWNLRNDFTNIGAQEGMHAKSNADLNDLPSNMLLLENYYKENNKFDEYKIILILLYKYFINHFRKSINSLSFIVSLQIMIDSPVIEEGESVFLYSLYKSIFPVFKDALITRMVINHNNLNEEVPVQGRGAKENTTRLQIFFEHINGDHYSLRLDLPHKGVNEFHLNLESKGQMKYFPISQDEYEVITSIDKKYETWFIDYGSKTYYIREKEKNSINMLDQAVDEEKIVYDIINKNHQYIIKSEINEAQVEVLLEELNRLVLSISKSMSTSKLDVQKQFDFSMFEMGIETFFSGILEKSSITDKEYMIRISNGVVYMLQYLFDVGKLSLDDSNELRDYLFSFSEESFEKKVSDVLELIYDEILNLEL